MDFCVGIGEWKRDLWNAQTREKLKKAGARKLSVGVPNFADWNQPLSETEALARLLQDEGFFPQTSHPHFQSYNHDFGTLQQNPERLAFELAWMCDFLTRCGLLGIRAIPLHTGGAMIASARPWEVDSLRRYADVMLSYAEKAKVVIAIENTQYPTPIGWYEGVPKPVAFDENRWERDSTENMIAFVDEYQSPWLKICYDTGHSHLYGDALKDLYAFGERIALFHLHDGDEGGCGLHVQPGYGCTPWKAMFDFIRGMKNDPVMYIEAAPYHGDLALMLREMDALFDNRVTEGPGGFYIKDEDTGHLAVTPRKEGERA